MKRIAIFASGNGSNAEALMAKCEEDAWEESIAIVVCDRPGAYVIERARERGISVVAMPPSSFPSKQAYEESVLQTLRSLQVEVLLLAGYMRLIGPTILQEYEGRIVNIHPSLLPAYPGLHAIERAYEAGEEEMGISIHLVDSGMDTGPVLQQVAVKRHDGATLEEMRTAIQQIEHNWYPKTVRAWLDDQKRKGGAEHEEKSVN